MDSTYLIISGTTRKTSKSLQISSLYQNLLSQHNIESKLLSLEDLPIEIFNINSKSDVLKKLESELLIPSSKLIFIVPEYNGSFPGSLKLLMDCCDTKNSFWNKKAALVGIADGRNGNLRGLDHLTGVLNYLKINVLHYKVNIPFITKSLDEKNAMNNHEIQDLLMKQINEFIKF
jgi:NAD(P)H-dependent FMN reductase